MTPSAKEGSYQSQSLPGRNPKTVTLQAIALAANRRSIPGTEKMVCFFADHSIVGTDLQQLSPAINCRLGYYACIHKLCRNVANHPASTCIVTQLKEE